MKKQDTAPTTEGRSEVEVDRRNFLAGAAGFVAGVSLLACESGNAEPAQAAQPTPPGPTPAPTPAEAPPAQPPADAVAKPADGVVKDAPAPDEKGAPGGGGGFPMKEKGKILQVTHNGATTNITKTNADVVKQMVSEALVKFTGEKDAVAAMGRFIKADDVVGIKVNCLGSPYASSDPATAFALAELVNQLGVPKTSITIYDQYGSRMRTGRFKPQNENQADPKSDYPVHFHGTMGYEDADTETMGIFKFKGKDGKYKKGMSKLPKVLKRFTAVINLCVAKDHDLTGITGAMKNVSYGNVDRVPVYHCQPECNPTCVHDGICNVARIYQHPEFGGKVRLVIGDALRVLYQGGPQDNMTYKKAPNSIFVSTDPVTMDRALLELINTYRKDNNLKPIEQDGGGRRAPRFIEGGAKLGLGEADLAKIKWDKVSLG